MAIDAMRQAFLDEGASYYFEAQEKAKKDLVSNIDWAMLREIVRKTSAEIKRYFTLAQGVGVRTYS